MGRKTAEQVTEGIDASGLTIIVTGGTNGLGKETVRVLAKRGARVFLAARNLTAAGEVKDTILKEIPDAKIDLLKIDLSSLESVRTAAQEFLALNIPLNVLINNAGIFWFPPLELSPDGIEIMFATNYLGHFLFTNLLLDKLKETAKETGIEGRIVNVSSESHAQHGYKEGIRLDNLNDKKGYTGFNGYGQSKLAQILHSIELSKRLQEEGANVTINSLHPGKVKTNIADHALLWMKPFVQILKLFQITVEEGAATQVYLALSPDITGVTGKYFDDLKEKAPKNIALDEDLQKQLWDVSMKMVSV